MKKMFIGMTLLASLSALADARSENMQRWQEMLSKGELTEKGFDKLVKKQLALDSDTQIGDNERKTIEDLENEFKAALDRGDITPLGYSKLILKLNELKNF